MSPSWRDQIQVFFAPERIDMVRSSRGFKPVQAPKIAKLCQKQEASQPLWEAPMQQLAQMLPDATGAEMTVTLSNHFVRYVTLPPQAEITTPEEVNAYAVFRMREIYSERVDAWVLSVSAWDPMDGAICAAIPRDLLTKFADLAARHKIKLKGVEPYFASVCDHWHETLTGTNLCLAIIERGHMCIALMNNGVWQSIRNQRVLHDVRDELRIALDQEVILSGNKENLEQVYLFAPEHPDLVLPEDCGWQVAALETERMSALAHYPTPIANHTEAGACVA